MSPEACLHAGRSFEALFYGCGRRWMVVGEPRRGQPSDHIEHLVIPKAPRGDGVNAVWERALELLARGTLTPWEYDGVGHRLPEQDARMAGFSLAGTRHELYLATPENFAPRLVQLTGPKGYWRMLQWRLEYAGSLKLNMGCVCVIDRGKEPPRYTPVPCGDEHAFFRMARTPYKAPAYRYERPPGEKDDRENWPRGMLEPWYPPGTKVYLDPRQIWLWDNSKPAKKRWVGQDARLWRHR